MNPWEAIQEFDNFMTTKSGGDGLQTRNILHVVYTGSSLKAFSQNAYNLDLES